MSLFSKHARMYMWFCALIVVQTLSAHAATVTMSWNQNAEDTLAGYRVYCGETSYDYTIIDDVGENTRHTMANLEEGKTYYFAATAYDIYGTESDFSEEISYTVPAPVPSTQEPEPEPAQEGTIALETGEVSTDHNWTHVQFDQTFSNPVVVANLLSFDGTDPSVIRLRNVSPTGFDIRVQEWDYLDGEHAVEKIGYIVIEKGTHVLPDGTRINAGIFTTNTTTSFEKIAFTTSLNTKPVIITSIATVAGEDGVTGRIQNITADGFEYCMQEQETGNQAHATETIMYIAWEESEGSIGNISFDVKNPQDLIADEFQTIQLDSNFEDTPVLLAEMQTYNGQDPATLRYTNKTNSSFDLRAYEEKSLDPEMEHANENIGYLAFSIGSANVDTTSDTSTDDDTGTTTPDDGTSNIDTASMELGEITADNNWKTIHFSKTYTDPVVIASGLSYAGTDPSTIRIRNVSPDGFEIRVQEWDYLDGPHAEETLGYIVAERGMHTLQDGTRICAGTVTTSKTNSFGATTFIEELPSVPVVLACITSTNDTSAVATRIKNISRTGFETGMQEQEKSDQKHLAETLSYIAWEKSSGTCDGHRYEVGTTGQIVDQTFNTFSFDTAFDATPIFMGSLQTYAGLDPSSLRFDSLSDQDVSLMVEEEQSADNETGHTAENAGYIVFEK